MSALMASNVEWASPSPNTTLARLSDAALAVMEGLDVLELDDLLSDPVARPLLDLIRITAERNQREYDSTPFTQLRTAVDNECALIRQMGESLSSAVESTMMSTCELTVHIAEASESMTAVSAASGELIETGEHVVAKADQTKTEAVRAGTTAREGANAVNLLVTKMATIDDMTSAVKKVTFQINLLAINSQIEAALAGDRGKGFAVVAAEVKTLAERTAALSREIEQCLNEIRANAKAAQSSFQLIEGAINLANASIVDLVDHQCKLNVAIVRQASQSTEATIKMTIVSDLIMSVQNTINEIGGSYTGLNGSIDNLAAATAQQFDDNFH